MSTGNPKRTTHKFWHFMISLQAMFAIFSSQSLTRAAVKYTTAVSKFGMCLELLMSTFQRFLWPIMTETRGNEQSLALLPFHFTLRLFIIITTLFFLKADEFSSLSAPLMFVGSSCYRSRAAYVGERQAIRAMLAVWGTANESRWTDPCIPRYITDGTHKIHLFNLLIELTPIHLTLFPSLLQMQDSDFCVINIHTYINKW